MSIRRRRFIKLDSLTSAVLPVINLKNIGSLKNNHSAIPFASDKELYKSFKNPGSIYRPLVRWWNGDRLQKKRNSAGADIMKAAGIGGVEINPIKFLSSTNDLNIKSLEY